MRSRRPETDPAGVSIVRRAIGHGAAVDDVVIGFQTGVHYRIVSTRDVEGGLEYELAEVGPAPAALPAVPEAPAAVEAIAPPVPPPLPGPSPVRKAATKVLKVKIGGQQRAEVAPIEGIRQDLLLEAAQRGTRWVRHDHPEFGRKGDAGALAAYETHRRLTTDAISADAVKAAGSVWKPDPPTPMKSAVDWDFAHWFNYLWKEVPVDRAERRQLYEWGAAHGSAATVEDRRACLQRMLDLGFVGVEQNAMRAVTGAGAGAPAEPNQGAGYFQTILPDLTKSGLMYRSDSRDLATITEHRGSIARSQVPKLVAQMNMNQPWNPFSDVALRNRMWLRRNSADNDLNTVVSLAVDPRDAVKFPLPLSKRSDGTTVEGGRDTANLYVVYVPRALDTSALVTENFGASSFGRGERGAVNVPTDRHLLHIVTDRAFADNSLAYVAGKVRRVTLLVDEEVLARLPADTCAALKTLRELLRTDLKWIVHGTPEAHGDSAQRHQEIAAAVDVDQRLAGLGLGCDTRHPVPPADRGTMGQAVALAVILGDRAVGWYEVLRGDQSYVAPALAEVEQWIGVVESEVKSARVGSKNGPAREYCNERLLVARRIRDAIAKR